MGREGVREGGDKTLSKTSTLPNSTRNLNSRGHYRIQGTVHNVHYWVWGPFHQRPWLPPKRVVLAITLWLQMTWQTETEIDNLHFTLAFLPLTYWKQNIFSSEESKTMKELWKNVKHLKILYSYHCGVWNLKCTLHSVECTPYTVQCPVQSVHCTVSVCLWSILRNLDCWREQWERPGGWVTRGKQCSVM